MAGLTYLFVAVVAVASLANATDFCNVQSCSNPREHTMCRFPSAQPSGNCIAYEAASLTPQEKRQIVDAHNRLRAKVASGQETRGIAGRQPAGRIPPLQWDDELEVVAQRWANQCDFNHDPCRDVDRYNVGQNIAIKMHSDGYKTSMEELVQMWYDEVKDFDARQVSRYQFNFKTGHYTQLVWGKTTTIGCGVVKYKKDNYWFATYLVCNYGPAGNYQGMPMYETR